MSGPKAYAKSTMSKVMASAAVGDYIVDYVNANMNEGDVFIHVSKDTLEALVARNHFTRPIVFDWGAPTLEAFEYGGVRTPAVYTPTMSVSRDTLSNSLDHLLTAVYELIASPLPVTASRVTKLQSAYQSYLHNVVTADLGIKLPIVKTKEET